MASRRLRVLTLTDNLDRAGGAERVAAYVAAGLDRSRFESYLCATRPTEGDLVDDVLRADVRLLRLERSSRAALWQLAPLVRLLRERRIDVVHAHKLGSNVWGVVLGRLTRAPLVVAHEHTWSFQGQPLRKALDREVIGRGADAFLAVSREDRRRMIEVEGVNPKKAVFLPNGIPPLPPATGHDVRGELGIDPGAPVVGSLSVLRDQKRLDVLIRAAALLHGDFPELRVLIPGVGPNAPELHALAAGLGVAGSIRFLGTRTDIPELLAALDVAVNSSDYEGSPLSVMEFMSAGKAIVATRVGGVPDLLEGGVHGLLVEPGDPAALAGALRRLLGDPDLRRRLGQAARERQQREFTLEAMVDRVEALYEDLFARTTRAAQEHWARPERRRDGS